MNADAVCRATTEVIKRAPERIVNYHYTVHVNYVTYIVCIIARRNSSSGNTRNTCIRVPTSENSVLLRARKRVSRACVDDFTKLLDKDDDNAWCTTYNKAIYSHISLRRRKNSNLDL